MQKPRLIRYVLLLCFTALSLASYAQTGSISGKVTDETGQPLPGAIIFIKGTNTNTMAGADGSFKLQPVNS